MATDIIQRLVNFDDIKIFKTNLQKRVTTGTIGNWTVQLTMTLPPDTSNRWTALVSTVGAGANSQLSGLWYLQCQGLGQARQAIQTLVSASAVSVTKIPDVNTNDSPGFVITNAGGGVVSVSVLILIDLNDYVTMSDPIFVAD